MTQNFAGAVRLKAYRDMIAEAEKKLKATEKEKERLEKEQAALKSNTEANLTRIEELKKKNAENLAQSRADSAAQVKNKVLLDDSRLRLQRRRDRLSALDRKN
jgi:predicted nuclease with TOPRIM domain